MSDGGRGRASLAVEVWKSSQNVDAERSAVRSIVWLGVWAICYHNHFTATFAFATNERQLRDFFYRENLAINRFAGVAIIREACRQQSDVQDANTSEASQRTQEGGM
jgi:hypothetical protein